MNTTNSHTENQATKTSGRSNDAAKGGVRNSLKLGKTVAGLSVALLLLMAGSARAADGTWDGGGSQPVGQAIWGGNNNWNPNGAVATGADSTATFGIAFNNGYRVIVNTARTIGHIVFNDPADANDLTLAEHASLYILTLDVTTGQPTINVAQPGRTLIIQPRIGGSDGLAKIGPGNLVLSNANLYTGPTMIQAGTLTLSNSLAIQNSVLDTANSIVGDTANGLKTTVAAITLGGLSGDKDFASVFTTTSGGYGTVTNLTLNPGSGVTNSYSGIIADGAAGMSLTKTGPGTQILSGANAFSGPAVVQGGMLAFNGGSLAVPIAINEGGALGLPGIGTVPGIEFLANGTMSFDVASGGMLTVAAANGVTNQGAAGSVTINITGVATADGTYTLIAYNGSLQGSGFSAYQLGATPVGKAYSLINSGSAVQLGVSTPFYWTGAQSSEWSTNSIGGLMNWTYLGSPADYGNGIGVLFDDMFTGTTTVDISVADVTPTSVIFNNASVEYTLQGSRAIAGSASLNKSGAATLTVLNNNSYSGMTLISAGTVQVGNGGTSGALGSGAIADNGDLQFNRSDAITITNLISGTGTLQQNGAGTLTLSGANTYAGATTINAGALQLGANNVLPDGSGKGSVTVIGTLDLSTYSDAINGLSGSGIVDTIAGGSPTLTVGGNNASSTFSGAIQNTAGSLSLSKIGTGTLTLSGVNTYSGGTTISGGIMTADGASALGTGPVTFNGGTRLLVGNSITVTNPITLGANVGVTGRGLIEPASGAQATISGPITISTNPAAGGHFATSGTGAILDVAGPITSSVSVAVRIGTIRFSGGGAGYTNLTLNQGTVIIGANNGIATNAIFSFLNAGAGILDLNGYNQSLAGITKGTPTATIGNSSTTSDSTLTTMDTSIFAGTIQDVVGSGARKVNLTVNGGTLTLTGTNTYSGATTINGGILLVNGVIGFGGVMVEAAGTLGGSGNIGGNVTNNGTISPGAGVGTLTSSSQIWNGGATYRFELSSATNSTGMDRLNINGELDVLATPDNKFTIKLVSMADNTTPGLVPDFDANTSYSWVIATGITIWNIDPSAFTIDTTAFSNAHSGTFSVTLQANTSLLVNYTPTPVLLILSSYGPLSGSSFPLTFSGPSGQNYQVLTSTNIALPTANWTVLSSSTFGTSPVTYNDTSATNPQQFYRIKSP